MACISLYLFLLCIVQFSENRQIKIQGCDMSRQFSRHHCRNQKTFSSNGYYNEILNLNGSIITSKELLAKKNSLKCQYKILHSNMVWYSWIKLPLNLRFMIEYLQNFHKYLPTKHLNVYSILVQRVVNFTTNWVSDIASIKCLKATILLR